MTEPLIDPTRMVPEPLVVCIMLTANRPDLAYRSIRCFERQTYQNKRLLIFETSEEASIVVIGAGKICVWDRSFAGCSDIAVLWNTACGFTAPGCLIAKWDDDDLSAPDRLTEQVRLIETTGMQCVGYRSMPFYHEEKDEVWVYSNLDTNYCLGTSMLMRREAWERHPFVQMPATPTRPACCSDTVFVRKLQARRQVKGFNGIGFNGIDRPQGPAMVVTLHAKSSHAKRQFDRALLDPHQLEWKRATPEMDAKVREMLRTA